MSKKTNIVLKKWKKNSREEYRVMIQEYRGQTLLSLRLWYTDRDGVLKPGNKGINIAPPIIGRIYFAECAGLVGRQDSSDS